MSKIIDQKDTGDCTRFFLNDGKVLDAIYGYSTGSELGIHNRFDTRTECRLYASIEDATDGNEEDCAGFECSADSSSEGGYDWDIWEKELLERLVALEWIERA